MLAEHHGRAGVWATVATATVAVLAFAEGPASADHHSESGSKPATVKAVEEGKDLLFTGPRTVKHGSKLKFVSTTNPKKVGPHTFTLITSKNMPTSKKKQKNCEQSKGVCGDIAAAHKFDPKTFVVHKPNVEAGKKGWDRPFGKLGDSWYTEKKGGATSRKVSAKAGTTLRYFCVVHPFMQGKIKVVK